MDLKAPDVRRMTRFHNHCVQTILGVKVSAVAE